MASLNRIFLIGRVAVVPELRYTPSGAAVANFRLAVDRKFSKSNETDFIPVVAWRRLAEICNEYLTKGKLVAIEGRLQVRSYEAQDGQKRTAFEVVADDMQMLDRGPSGGDRRQGSGEHSREPVGAAVSGGGGDFPPEPGFGDDGLGMDDIPF